MATVSYARTASSSQAQAAIDCLEDALTRQGAWTKMATVTSGTSQPCSVWRNTGTRNALGRDWYLAVGRTVGTNPVSFSVAVAEGFDQDRGTLIRPAPGSAASTTRPAEDFSYGGGLGFPIWNGNSLNAVDIEWATMSIGTTIYDTYAIVTNDTVAFIRGGGSVASSYFFLGLGESFMKEEAGIIGISDTGGTRLTRAPEVTVVNSANWQAYAMTSTASYWTQRAGVIGQAGDRLHGLRPVGTRMLIKHSGAAYTTGSLRGLWPNVLSIDTDTDLVMFGEKIFVGPDQYMFAGSYDLWFNTAPT